MPNLRSTRQRKVSNQENLETNSTKSNQTQAAKQKSKRYTLRELGPLDNNNNKGEHLRKLPGKKLQKGSMPNEGGMQENDGERPEDSVNKVGPAEKPEIVNKDENATAEEESNIKEPMEVDAEEEEKTEEGPSPSKKQKMSDDIGHPENIEADEDTIQEKNVEPEKDEAAEQSLPAADKIQSVDVNEKQATTTTASKTNSISLKSQANKSADKVEANPGHTSNMPEQLLTVISNLYLDVGKRLRLDFLPRCLDDLAHCHQHHYHSELPEAPMHSQAHSLRSALQHYRYVSFINSTIDMCHRGEFPGKGIFTKIIELVLSINFNTKQNNVLIFQQSYHKAIDLFSMIVRTFPPCWHKLRTYYVGFLEHGLDQAKLGDTKVEPLSKSSKIFDIILDLFEDIVQNATAEEFSTNPSESLQTTLGLSQETKKVELTSPQQNSVDLSVCSEFWNQNEYEERERQKQTFTALPMAQKIERIFVCLRLLLEILENDLAMWMLHHFKKTKEWIFCSDNRPLIVVLCELTQYTRMTRVARRIFSIYSESASKGLCKGRLQVLERYISLLMVASNTADMENTAIGVKYPSLGDHTVTLIKEFFKIFKVYNREEISKYMETIDLLRIPYVRFEFIDNVLFTNAEPLTPQKIAVDIAKKRWLKYKPKSELLKPDDEISREQYLHLLLDALRQYCDWHGSKTFLHVITNSMQVTHLTTTNDSVHRWPTHGAGILVLKKMAKDIKQLETQLKMTVRMSKPKVNISMADICIDEAIILKYRNDLKFVISLQNVLLKQKEAYPEVDFSEWLQFLNEFSSKKLAKPAVEEQASLP